MKVLITVDINDNRPGKAVRLYDMKGKALGYGEQIVGKAETKAGDLFTSNSGMITYQALLAEGDKLTVEEWRAKYLTNGFYVPECSDEDFAELAEYWKKNRGSFVYVDTSREVHCEKTEEVPVSEQPKETPVVEDAVVVNDSFAVGKALDKAVEKVMSSFDDKRKEELKAMYDYGMINPHPNVELVKAGLEEMQNVDTAPWEEPDKFGANDFTVQKREEAKTPEVKKETPSCDDLDLFGGML